MIQQRRAVFTAAWRNQIQIPQQRGSGESGRGLGNIEGVTAQTPHNGGVELKLDAKPRPKCCLKGWLRKVSSSTVFELSTPSLTEILSKLSGMNMNKTLLLIKHEFLGTVRRKPLIFLPLLSPDCAWNLSRPVLPGMIKTTTTTEKVGFVDQVGIFTQISLR